MRDDTFDVISPELALVDPELATRARAQLPEPGLWRPAYREPDTTPARRDRERDVLRLLLEERRSRPAEIPAAPVPEPEPVRRRMPVGVLVPAVAAVLVVAVMGALVALDHGLAQGSRPVLLDSPTPAVAAPVQPPRAPAVPPASSRLFGWAPAPAAKAYELRLIRRGRLIYRTRTPNARATVPATWVFRGQRYRLVAGRYAWQVRPLLRGSRLGRPLVQATVDVSVDSS